MIDHRASSDRDPLSCLELHHSFGSRKVLEGVTLGVHHGAVLGLIGRNGAGKSTLIRILLGLTRPDRGESRVYGRDSLELDDTVKERLAYVPQQPDAFQWMKVGDTVWLIFMAIPITLSFLSQETISVFLQYYFGTVASAFAFSGVTVLVARARRSGELLWNQQGEIADLAILPGLGDTRCQRRALLHEALIRPLIHYTAWFCGVTGSWWVLVWTGRAPVQSILLLPELMVSMLMLFATMSVGVLSSQLDRLSMWFKGAAWVSTIPAFFSLISLQLWSFGLLHAPASPSSLLIWQSIANVSIVGGMAVCLITWGIQLSRRPNLLCR